MSHDTSTRSFDARAIVLMIVVIAAAVGLIGLVLEHMSVDSSKIHPIASAHATSQTSSAKKAVEAVANTEETWAADESARGTRPEASH